MRHNISYSEAALILRQERARLTRRRAALTETIRESQREIDHIDQRLREVDEGERVLSEDGY